ncbi:N-6 DNA methylase [Amycolatopsis rubida]|uniref:site-specific DNA-methyltransferase (adenine-specific) n=1 Tax=Amycolatopsis rubida TaxID=112413 RepID=A0A1I5G368_9PSEU|nr:N-6 DNA methylase [Amycolatopsis rubida]SFO30404.1 type I restriction enzyme M protein [Amycolatopsis rubida]
MSLPEGMRSAADLAKLAEVNASAFSNWRSRSPEFPPPHKIGGKELFEIPAVAEWLKERRIPVHRRKEGEPEGYTYGDRLLRNLGPGQLPDSGAAQTRPVTEADLADRVWEAVESMLDSLDRFAALDYLLGLVYLRSAQPADWKAVTGTRTWPEAQEVLRGISVPVPGAADRLLFTRVLEVSSPALRKAVDLVDRFPAKENAGQLGSVLLGLTRRQSGRSGGQFTPPEVARLMVDLLGDEPVYSAYDPFCGSGELLTVAAERIAGVPADVPIEVFGKAGDQWSWSTSWMNLALHGVEAELGEPGLAVKKDSFPGLTFDRILANPPFNLKSAELDKRVLRWGEPPEKNANFAWLQHVAAKLAPSGRAAVIMPSGAASSKNEAHIRGALIEDGIVECVIALPARLFRFTAIPVHLWLLRAPGCNVFGDEVLLIDASDEAEADRSARRLTTAAIDRAVDEHRRWSSSQKGSFFGSPGYSRAVPYSELEEGDYNLQPARYVSRKAEHREDGPAAAFAAARRELAELTEQVRQLNDGLESTAAAVLSSGRAKVTGERVRLGKVCEVLPGPGSVKRQGDSPGTPLVLPRNIRNNQVDYGELDLVPEALAARYARYRLAERDVVSARAGTLGRFGLVRSAEAGWLLGPGCVGFRPGPEVDPHYLVYYLNGADAQEWLRRNAVGTAVRYFSSDLLRSMPIFLPELRKQAEIVDLLRPYQLSSVAHAELGSQLAHSLDLLTSILFRPSA